MFPKRSECSFKMTAPGGVSATARRLAVALFAWLSFFVADFSRAAEIPIPGGFLAGLSFVVPVLTHADEIPIPGGFADTKSSTVFVNNEKSALVALDLEKGTVLWSSMEAYKPMMLSKEGLVALAFDAKKSNILRVVILDPAQKGKKGFESEPVTFPDWVDVQARRKLEGHQADRSFIADCRLDKDDLILNWSASYTPISGMPLRPGDEKSALGSANVNLKSGKVAMKEKQEKAIDLTKHLEKTDTAIYIYHWMTNSPKKWFKIGSTKLGMLVQPHGADKLLLKTFNQVTGEALEIKELLKGEGFFPYLSLDGTYAIISQKADGKDKTDKKSWFALEDGKPVKDFSSAAWNELYKSPLGFGVVGDLSFYSVDKPENPKDKYRKMLRHLIAMDLKTNKKLWEHQLPGWQEFPPVP